MPSRPPEPTQEELEKYGRFESDIPGGVIVKDDEIITVKREPTEEERREVRKREKRELERRKRRKRRREREEEEQEKRASVAPPTTPKGAGLVGLKVEISTKEPPPKPLEEPRLDEEPFPGEPTFAERLHGVTRETAPTPKVIQDVGKALGKYEKIMEQPSMALREKAGIALVKAEEAKVSGKDVEAGLRFMESSLYRAGAGTWAGATLPFRPTAIVETVKTAYLLATSKEARALAITDPGFVYELGGGFLGGSITAKGLSRLGKPKTYRLKQKTSLKQISTGIGKGYSLEPTRTTKGPSPASLFPKGKWRSTWEIVKKGGTAVLMEPETGMVTTWVPTPVYQPSLFPPIMGAISTLRKTPTVDEPIIDRAERTIEKGYLDEMERMQKKTIEITEQAQKERPTITPETTELPLIIRPVGYKEIERPLIYPEYIQKRRPKAKIDIDEILKPRTKPSVTDIPIPIEMVGRTQRERPWVEPGYIQEPDISLIQVPDVKTRQRQRVVSASALISLSTEVPDVKIKIPLLKKKPRKGALDLLSIGEMREYDVRLPEEMFKDILEPTKRRKRRRRK